jgi:hypothetical protein
LPGTLPHHPAGTLKKEVQMRKITKEEIESQQTENGGWTKSTLEQWGVPWPPPKGWKERLLKFGVPYQG